MTWLGYLNFIIVQFLFCRVYMVVGGGKTTGFGVMYWVMPLSGWWDDYKIIGHRMKMKRIINI